MDEMLLPLCPLVVRENISLYSCERCKKKLIRKIFTGLFFETYNISTIYIFITHLLMVIKADLTNLQK